MSFRLRIFVLVLLTAVTAIGATAFLTLKLTTREVSAAREASAQHQQEIIDTVAEFGLAHGKWPGLDQVAEDLSQRTNLHIRLRTVDGETLVDRGFELRALGDDVVVKLAATRVGASACARLAAGR